MYPIPRYNVFTVMQLLLRVPLTWYILPHALSLVSQCVILTLLHNCSALGFTRLPVIPGFYSYMCPPGFIFASVPLELPCPNTDARSHPARAAPFQRPAQPTFVSAALLPLPSPPALAQRRTATLRRRDHDLPTTPRVRTSPRPCPSPCP